MKRRFALTTLVSMVAASLPFLTGAAIPPGSTSTNPVATDPVSYAAYGRVFPDPQGCLAHDADGDGVNDVVPPEVSPWAKGNVCTNQFLSYEDVLAGARFLEELYPRYFQVIRLDEAYDNPEFQSAGIPRTFTLQDGLVKPLDRDRRPLYLMKVTDSESPIAEDMRLHFVYAGAIHGPERAGAEGGIRALEDLVTWAAHDPEQRIIETPTEDPVPTAKETLERSVVYFMLPNPDGWARGQTAPAEFEDGSPNLQYTPGGAYQRFNGNGMDLNRDWPGMGYVFKPYSPGSEPETRAYMHALLGIRDNISPDNPMGQRFAGGIDLHGMLTANAFSFTLLGAGQRDFSKTESSIDQSLRAWADQETRLSWSPLIGTVFEAADQWGTVMDTINYQVSGSLGDFFDDEKLGLGAVGIDNEMALSHLAPNSVFEPMLEQMHIDGNKGLIFSQMASMLTQARFDYEPAGRLGYVMNPVRIENEGSGHVENPGLPAQNDIEALLPCVEGVGGPTEAIGCDGGTFYREGQNLVLEFEMKGPKDGVWNGGVVATMTNMHANGVSAGMLAQLSLEMWDEDDQTWEPAARSFVSEIFYAHGGQHVTVNDPMPGRWRAVVSLYGGVGPVRVKMDFRAKEAESGPGQAGFSASSMDFFTDLNANIPDPADHAVAVTVEEIVAGSASLDSLDSLVVVNRIGDRDFLRDTLGLSPAQINAYHANLRGFVERGGNLVLTDAALLAAEGMGLLPAGSVNTNKPGIRGLSPRYTGVCNGDTDPLEKDVCLPGTAGGQHRQAVEPRPLGYSPDTSRDNDPAAIMDQWFVNRAAWEAAGGSHSAALPEGSSGNTGLGQLPLGDGRVVIVGAMFPDPNFAPNQTRDMRFGLDSYSLTFSAWRIFLNTIDYSR